MKTILFAILLCAALSACSTVEQRPAQRQTGFFPEVGKQTTVSVGQVMISKYDFSSYSTAVLLEEIKGSFWTARSGIDAGAKLSAGIADGKEIFCSGRGKGAACVEDKDRDGRFDRAYTMDAFGMIEAGHDVPPAAYRLENSTMLSGFKYELLYEGIDKDVVRVAYREYTDSVARPAFNQDLTYTLDSNGQAHIQFRAVAAVVAHADNGEIRFVVEKGF